jgi:hypothetical protein
MSALTWDNFDALAGSSSDNFEKLARALIRLHYGRFGSLRATANQPGVEFHLKLHSSCALGEAGRWFGWQCRWYDLPKGRPLGAARKKKILHAITTTERVLPGLTDWILWTRYPLTSRDEKWFYAQKTKMRLDAWNEAETETLLTGDALILRATFFGEFVLTNQNLADLHREAIASVRHRWLPEAHQAVAAERTIRQMSGETSAWSNVTAIANRLRAAHESLETAKRLLSGNLAVMTDELLAVVDYTASLLVDTAKLLTVGNFDVLRETLQSRQIKVSKSVAAVPRHLRAASSPTSFEATNALVDLYTASSLLRDIDRYLGSRLIALIADAGGGKTQVSAEITAPTASRPAGIFLHGRELKAGQNLDDLARRLVFQGKPFPSIESLVAALDAAALRASCRLPLIIDGLNEAEDPRDWKAPLAKLEVALQRYPNVLVVCTLRTGAVRPAEEYYFQRSYEVDPATRSFFADIALPTGVQRLEMEGFGEDATDAIRRYFQYYRIRVAEAEIPVYLLSQPLQLRLFCEVTNPKRDRDVGIEAMPRSLTGLFERYVADATQRVADLAPTTGRYYALDVRRVLTTFGSELWNHRSRMLDEAAFRKLVGDDNRLWDASIIRLLEQEGVILRVGDPQSGRYSLIAVYDALGGHLVANAITSGLGADEFTHWLADAKNIEALNGSYPKLHPLASDIFRSLVGLVPRRYHNKQLWTLVSGALRNAALMYSPRLESELIDAATVQALGLVVRKDGDPNLIFRRLQETRSAPNHPLNADFLDAQLRQMSNADRDPRWTEWLRHRYDDKFGRYNNRFDPNGLETSWRVSVSPRTAADRLRAKWIMWYLTSTAREMRDKATRALYWFGRGEPAALFELTAASLSISDSYVVERILAASYGVAMALHSDIAMRRASSADLTNFVRTIYDQMFRPGAPCGTTHLLAREYARRILQLGVLHKPKLFSATEKRHIKPPYKFNGIREWKTAETYQGEYAPESPFGMDFVNYTLGRLVPNRSNYDFSNPEYLDVRAKMLWRVHDLGWSFERFGAIDNQIRNSRSYFGRRDDSNKVDRYGKKYSLIAYHEMHGLLEDLGVLEAGYNDGRPSEVDLDPSFPAAVPEGELIKIDLLAGSFASTKDWIAHGATPNLRPYLRQQTVRDAAGPWITLDGFVTQEDKRRGRRMFAFIRSFIVPVANSRRLAKALSKQSMHGRWLPEKPSIRDTFAGELPWCTTFPRNGNTTLQFVLREWKEKIRRKQDVFVVDGQEVSVVEFYTSILGALDRLKSTAPDAAGSPRMPRIGKKRKFFESEEVRRETSDFNVLIPVCDFSWERNTIDDVSVHSPTLAKEIGNTLKLVGIPQSVDLETQAGVAVTCAVEHQRRSFQNSQHLFFMREELLRNYLRERRQDLVWVIWGERQIATNLVGQWRAGSKEDGPSYKVFSKVLRLM